MPEMDGFEATAGTSASEEASGGAPAHHRHDGPRHEGRPRALPGRRHGRLRRQADPGRRVVPGPGGIAAAPSPQPVPATPAPGIINWTEFAQKRVGGDSQLLGELLTVFLAEFPQWRTDLHQALERQDTERMRQIAHTDQGFDGPDLRSKRLRRRPAPGIGRQGALLPGAPPRPMRSWKKRWTVCCR